MPLNITILGIDTLTRSLGLALGTLDQTALTSGRPRITGWDRDGRTARDARNRLEIDQAARDLPEAVRDADVVFLNNTPATIGETFREIAPHLKHGAVVSDLGSAKTQVLAAAKAQLPTTVDFIGGHPILNSATGLPANASIDLFKRAIYCLVPAVNARPAAIDTIAALVEAIGAKPYYIDAAEHDAYIAGAQHLPQIVGAALMETLSRSGGWREMQPLAGELLRTATQAAAGDAAVISAACVSNQVAIENRLNDLIRVLIEVRDTLHQPDQIEAIFEHAHESYIQWQAAQPNMRPGENAFMGENEQIDRSFSALLFGHRKKRK